MERLIASVQALDHDGRPRLVFRVHQDEAGLVAERIEAPGSPGEVRSRGSCAGARELYDSFGDEPLANYLCGRLGAPVPGLRTEPVER